MEQTTQDTGEVTSELPETAEENSVDWSAIAAEPETIEGDTEVLDEGGEVGDTTDAPVVEVAPVVAPVEPAAEETPVVDIPRAPVPAFDMEKWEEDSVAQLQELYKLSEEDTRSLLTEPETVLPRLLAKAHMQMTKSVLESVQGIIPNVMETTQVASKAETEARNAFFSVNRDLAKPEYEEAILAAGSVFRKLNPNTPRDEAVKRIGEMARVSLGLPLLSWQVQVAPAAPAPQPFTPARGNTGGRAPASKNAWAGLAAEFENEDN